MRITKDGGGDLGRLNAGAAFGELALLSDEPRQVRNSVHVCLCLCVRRIGKPHNRVIPRYKPRCRQVSITAVGPVTCCVIGRADFRKVLGPMAQFMKFTRYDIGAVQERT